MTEILYFVPSICYGKLFYFCLKNLRNEIGANQYIYCTEEVQRKLGMWTVENAPFDQRRPHFTQATKIRLPKEHIEVVGGTGAAKSTERLHPDRLHSGGTEHEGGDRAIT